MELITVDLLLDRLLINPALAGLRVGQVSSYMRDFSSINGIRPLLGFYYSYNKVTQYKAKMEPNLLRLENVYKCQESNLDRAFFENEKLHASLTDSLVRDQDKEFYGAYVLQDDILTVDFEEGLVEAQYVAMRTDEKGFPVLPYDGSLMMAITNFVKWQHFDLLSDSEIVSDQRVRKAEREYTWYIGQYQMKNDIPSYDEAVSWANNWQTLLNTRDKGLEGDHLDKQFRW